MKLTLTPSKIKKIKSKMQILYRKMNQLGLKPMRSSVAFELHDEYEYHLEGVRVSRLFLRSTIASTIKNANRLLSSTTSLEEWQDLGLYDFPDQITFEVEDEYGIGSATLIVSLKGSQNSNYMGWIVYDNQFNVLSESSRSD